MKKFNVSLQIFVRDESSPLGSVLYAETLAVTVPARVLFTLLFYIFKLLEPFEAK